MSLLVSCKKTAFEVEPTRWKFLPRREVIGDINTIVYKNVALNSATTIANTYSESTQFSSEKPFILDLTPLNIGTETYIAQDNVVNKYTEINKTIQYFVTPVSPATVWNKYLQDFETVEGEGSYEFTVRPVTYVDMVPLTFTLAPEKFSYYIREDGNILVNIFNLSVVKGQYYAIAMNETESNLDIIAKTSEQSGTAGLIEPTHYSWDFDMPGCFYYIKAAASGIYSGVVLLEMMEAKYTLDGVVLTA